MAAHHVYVEVVCPCCLQQRTTRKDLLAKAVKQQKQLFCKPCALKARPVTWKKSVEELVRNQGAYKSYCKAKRRVKTNHKNAYAHVEFKFESYEQFLKELGPRPEGSLLDRIDPKGNYEPGNVRWATQAEQNRNKRNNVFVVYEGKKMCLNDAAKITGKDRNALKRRIETGCPSELLFQDGKWCSKTQKFLPTDTAK
jgi:hypothetical protein